jgi:hypothetical protein
MWQRPSERRRGGTDGGRWKRGPGGDGRRCPNAGWKARILNAAKSTRSVGAGARNGARVERRNKLLRPPPPRRTAARLRLPRKPSAARASRQPLPPPLAALRARSLPTGPQPYLPAFPGQRAYPAATALRRIARLTRPLRQREVFKTPHVRISLINDSSTPVACPPARPGQPSAQTTAACLAAWVSGLLRRRRRRSGVVRARTPGAHPRPALRPHAPRSNTICVLVHQGYERRACRLDSVRTPASTRGAAAAGRRGRA